MPPGQVHQLAIKKGSAGYLMEFNIDFYPSGEKPASQVLPKVAVNIVENLIAVCAVIDPVKLRADYFAG